MTPAQVPEWLATAAAAVSSPVVLLLAFLGLVGVGLVEQRWRQAYTFLLAGPALLGALTLVHLRWPLDGPVPPPYPLVQGWAATGSALGLSLAVCLAWRSRVRLGACLAWAAAGCLLAVAPVVAGTETFDNALLGAAFGLAWAAGSIAAAQLVSALVAPDQEVRPAVAAWLGRLTDGLERAVWGKAWVPWALVAVGLLCRIPGIWTWSLGPDASRYAAMADALNRHGDFLMPWGDIYSPGTGLQASRHFPPLYPALLAAFYKVFGFSEATTRLVSLLLAAGAIVVAYACTRDLYGRARAGIAAAVVALSPVLVMTTNKAYSENLLLILFVAAMWAILKSLDKPWFIVLGALFAGLGYLTKSSMGYFFIVAGLGGLAWRLHWKGWRVLRDPAYVTAVLLFGAMVAWWGWRNWQHFGSPATSSHLDAAYAFSFANPGGWAVLMVFSLLVMFGLGYLVYMAALPWLPLLRRIPRLASEHDSGLWLAIALPLVLTVAIDAALWLYEGTFYLHNVRYVSFVIVPLAWLIMRHAKRSRQATAAIIVSFAILLAGSVYYAAVPNRPLNTIVADEFGDLVTDGDSITFVGDNDVYRYYFAVTKDGREMDHDVRYQDTLVGNETTDWIVIRNGTGVIAGDLYGYRLVLDRSQGEGLLAERYWVLENYEHRCLRPPCPAAT